jgi:lipid-binding SYLF domain-containing protein
MWATGLAVMIACSAPARSAGWNPEDSGNLRDAAVHTMARFMETDPTLKTYFDKAYGYAVFPSIGKGGFVFSGAFGRGIVYQQGAPVGRASMTQVSFGFTIGGQAYSEILFFRDKAALDNFMASNTEFSAHASAVMARHGAAAQTSYDQNGVAVFLLVKGGAMAEAAVGGQKFRYESGLD